MTNAVERLWQALAVGDLERAAAELHPSLVVDWPHTGERFESAAAFLAVHRTDRRVELRRVITDGHHVAVEAFVEGDAASWAVAAFYDLRDGRISRAAEYWVQTR